MSSPCPENGRHPPSVGLIDRIDLVRTLFPSWTDPSDANQDKRPIFSRCVTDLSVFLASDVRGRTDDDQDQG